jgi:hypothetical protein
MNHCIAVGVGNASRIRKVRKATHKVEKCILAFTPDDEVNVLPVIAKDDLGLRGRMTAAESNQNVAAKALCSSPNQKSALIRGGCRRYSYANRRL